ncbi:MAG: enoyl-CoA hydratase-related protein [Dehalococcoidia bacterium]
MATQAYIEHARRGPVSTITMRRPEVHNAFNEEVIAQLTAAFEEVRDSRETRVVVLAGAGPSFSAGADLDWMQRMAAAREDENHRDAERLAAMLRGVAECPCPVVAKVRGSAFGGGAGLVAAADLAIAAESARLGFTEVRLGLVPATIARHVIRKIGAGRALALFLTGERIDARAALAAGLVHRVVPEGELDAAVDEVVISLLAGGPGAQRDCKELVRRIAGDDAGADAYASGLIARVRSGDEGQEGVAAFLARRKPRWAADGDV